MAAPALEPCARRAFLGSAIADAHEWR